MSRELKFREWVHGKFHYWGFVNEGSFHGPATPSVTRGIHGQFTGLHDKNGKEIYEGDIVKFARKERFCKTKTCENSGDKVRLGIDRFCPKCGSKMEPEDFVTIAEIGFEKGAFHLHYYHEEYHTTWKFFVAEIFIEWIEVIGNIYANPELLTTTP